MKKALEVIKNFCKEEDGVTAIEYGLLAALIAVVCVGVWKTIGASLLVKFTAVDTALK